MKVRIVVEDNSIVKLLTDKVNGVKFDSSIAERMFKYRDEEYGICVPSKAVFKKLNNYARSYYKLAFTNNTAVVPVSKLLK